MEVDLEALMRAARVAAGTDRAVLFEAAADEIARLRSEVASLRRGAATGRPAFMNPPTPKWAPPVADLAVMPGAACTCMRARSSACKVHGEGEAVKTPTPVCACHMLKSRSHCPVHGIFDVGGVS